MDDNKEIRDMVVPMMNYRGYDIECAKDGVEAINIYKKAMGSNKPFDLVIMDLTIQGGMGAKEAIRKLHEIDHEAKAIVFSGYTNDPIINGELQRIWFSRCN